MTPEILTLLDMMKKKKGIFVLINSILPSRGLCFFFLFFWGAGNRNSALVIRSTTQLYLQVSQVLSGVPGYLSSCNHSGTFIKYSLHERKSSGMLELDRLTIFFFF